MKHLILIVIFSFISNISFSQIYVYLKNGEITTGAIGLMKRDVLKLKNSKKDKSVKLKAKEIDSVVFLDGGNAKVFHSVGEKKPRFYQLCSRGKLNVYMSESMTVTGYGSFSSTFFYLKKKNENKMVDFSNSWKWFYKMVAEEFPDCPSLIEKVKNEEEGFTRSDIKNIGEYYNTHCGS